MDKKDRVIDWNSIKKDYIIGMSYRQISEKHNVGLASISEHANKGGWKRTKEQVIEKSEQRMVERLVDRNSKIADNIADAVDIAVMKIQAGLRVVDKKDATKIRSYMSALKDARDMGLYRSEMDKAEQNARIKKLEKEASSEAQDNTINVVISEEVDEYAN